MIATDPLSLLFLGCALFAGVFLAITTLVSGGAGHSLHLGQLHVGGHAGHVGHVGGNAAAHSATSHGPGHGGVGMGVGDAPLSALRAAFLDSLNLYGLLVFLLLFGALGYLLHTNGVLTLVAIVVAAVVGVVCAMVVNAALMRIFLLGEPAGLSAESSRLEGRLARVSIAIRAGGVGEAVFQSASGSRQSLGARSATGEAIPVDAEVVILSATDGIAEVEPWDVFMAQARAGVAPALDQIEIH